MNDVDRPLTCTHCGFLLKVGRMATCPQCGHRLLGANVSTPSSPRVARVAHQDTDSGVLQLSGSVGTAVAEAPRGAGADYAPKHFVDRSWESSPADAQTWLDTLKAFTSQTLGAVFGLFRAESR
jgi:hypothetical protein